MHIQSAVHTCIEYHCCPALGHEYGVFFLAKRVKKPLNSSKCPYCVHNSFMYSNSFQARRLEALGAIGGIVLDNTPGTSATSSPMFAMSGDGTNDVSIPLVFLFSGDAEVLLKALQDNPDLEVVLSDYVEKGGLCN